MRSLVVDTSVVAAWYLDEDNSRDARQWLDLYLKGDLRLFAPSLQQLELANVLRTHVVRGRLSREQASEIWQLHQSMAIELVEPAWSNVLDVAFDYEATAYDAAFIEVALALDLPLLTAERTTAAWVVKLGERAVSIRTPRR